MINLLFLLATAHASDVYEICVNHRKVWHESSQSWKHERTSSYFTTQPVQFIIHKNTFEVDRSVKKIQSKETIDGLKCFREHENSFICHDPGKNLFLWEFHYRSGKVTRDEMKICVKNGEGV